MIHNDEPRCPGREAFLTEARDLEPGAFRRLVGQRARRLLGRDHGAAANEQKRREMEQEIGLHFEKIHKGADFLPASFLEKGAERSRAVCRIATPTGYGTGFLISRGLLITNHHVLDHPRTAAGSIAEFHYEAGRKTVQVALEPQRFFYSQPRLDFTLVACAPGDLEDIQPVRLYLDPATITRNEVVNIIQHPGGRMKEIAIHNNPVVRVKDLVVHYRTDTEPGSSGSPVFNNQWELVALHHAGWKEIRGAVNEGIRMTAIAKDLLNQFFRNENAPVEMDLLLESLTRTLPITPFPGVREPGPLKPKAA